MDKRDIKDTRRRHSDAMKFELVERSLRPGASVAALAQENGINANLLFNWRRLHLRALGADAAAITAPTLLYPRSIKRLQRRGHPHRCDKRWVDEHGL